MRVRFWLAVLDAALVLDRRINRTFTWNLALWAINRAAAAHYMGHGCDLSKETGEVPW